jgi:hypothetical protein
MLTLTTIDKDVLETLGGARNQDGMTRDIQRCPAFRFLKPWLR